MIISGLSLDEGPDVLAQILDDLPAFWGERDLRALHHPMWLRQFVDQAVLAREDGLLLGYLFGTVTVHRLSYVHLIATRTERQGQGIGRRLYETFLAQARAAGADRVEAITTPANHGSIAFHRRLGFSADAVPDYAGPGQPRILFRQALSPTPDHP
jgi:ribosomal protein S18 acetylase RimI-like enzyme